MKRATEASRPAPDAASTHPHLPVLERFFELIAGTSTDTDGLFAESFVWRYYNDHAPDLAGDYHGAEGVREFMQKLGTMMEGSFHVQEAETPYIGDELAVAVARHATTLGGQRMQLEAVVVFRIVDGRIAEAWDIPATYTIRPAVERKDRAGWS